jgi:Fur family ferric uptake transcriptional regulator
MKEMRPVANGRRSSLKTMNLSKSSDPLRCEDIAHASVGHLMHIPDGYTRTTTGSTVTSTRRIIMIDDHQSDSALILERMRARGERVTTPRRAVIELLAGTHEHLTVDDIANRLHEAHPSIAPSTVYRTLEALQDWGMVEKVHRGRGATFFHLAQTHQHIVCEVCGSVSDIPAHELADLEQRLLAAYDFQLHPSHFALLGQCAHHRDGG